MTSNDMSSSSQKTNGQGKMTYDKLLSEPQRLRQVVWLLGSQGWEAMELWLQTERQAHLESFIEEEDPQKREGHRIIAKWITYFLTIAKDYLTDAEYAIRHPEPPVETEYMEYDSEGKAPEGVDTDVPVGQN